jgi:dTDP-D-glucose 4,6-dehydratase
VINKLLNNEKIKIHVGPTNKIGGRRWFYAGNVASHTRFIINNQKTFCEKWNSAGKEFIDNLTFSKMISKILGKELDFELIPVDRPGHDLCFSVDPSKLYDLGWEEKVSTYERLEETINWYLKNPNWLNRN